VVIVRMHQQHGECHWSMVAMGRDSTARRSHRSVDWSPTEDRSVDQLWIPHIDTGASASEARARRGPSDPHSLSPRCPIYGVDVLSARR